MSLAPPLHPAATADAARAAAPAQAAGFWQTPWRMPQALTVVVAAVGIGMIVQASRPAVEVALPPPPWNWIGVFAPLVLLLGAGRLWPANGLLASLGGIPLAIVSVLAMALIVLPAAIWPQGADAPEWLHPFGFDHVFSSFPLAAATALVLINLAVSSGRRLQSLRAPDVRYQLVHVGLLLAIGSAAAGTASLQRVQIPLVAGGAAAAEGIRGGATIPLPFDVRLDRFDMTNFAPTLAHAVRPAGAPDADYTITAGSTLLAAGATDTIGGYHVRVAEYLPRAAVLAGKAVPFDHPGTGPAALVEVAAPRGETIGSGWLHAETEWGGELFLRLPDESVLLLARPKPRSFHSDITLTAAGRTRSARVGVNERVRVAGWSLYQLSYDEAAGDASRLSVLEAVRDPAYPFVALGAWLCIAGCIWSIASAAQSAPSRLSRPEGRP